MQKTNSKGNKTGNNLEMEFIRTFKYQIPEKVSDYVSIPLVEGKEQEKTNPQTR